MFGSVRGSKHPPFPALPPSQAHILEAPCGQSPSSSVWRSWRPPSPGGRRPAKAVGGPGSLLHAVLRSATSCSATPPAPSPPLSTPCSTTCTPLAHRAALGDPICSTAIGSLTQCGTPKAPKFQLWRNIKTVAAPICKAVCIPCQAAKDQMADAARYVSEADCKSNTVSFQQAVVVYGPCDDEIGEDIALAMEEALDGSDVEYSGCSEQSVSVAAAAAAGSSRPKPAAKKPLGKRPPRAPRPLGPRRQLLQSAVSGWLLRAAAVALPDG